MLRTQFALVEIIGVALLVAAPCALAQIPDPVAAVEAPTPGSGHNYIGSATETVNPADGSLSFDLPLPTPPGRGISFPLSIHYNSGLQYYLTSDSNSGSTFPALNWAPLPQPYSLFTVPFLSFRAAIESAQYIPSQGSQGQSFTYEQCDFTTNFIFRGLDGVQYPLGQVGATWSEEDPSPGARRIRTASIHRRRAAHGTGFLSRPAPKTQILPMASRRW